MFIKGYGKESFVTTVETADLHAHKALHPLLACRWAVFYRVTVLMKKHKLSAGLCDSTFIHHHFYLTFTICFYLFFCIYILPVTWFYA